MTADTYIVAWSMPITADDPVDAARQALEIQRDPVSAATVFFVEPEDDADDRRWRVELDKRGELVKAVSAWDEEADEEEPLTGEDVGQLRASFGGEGDWA